MTLIFGKSWDDFDFFFLDFQAEGEDELKKRQLMELAIINGTYRDSKENKIVPNNLSNLIAGIRSTTSQQQVSQIGQSSPGSLGNLRREANGG